MEDHFKDILIIIILQLIRIFRSMATPYNIKRRNRKKRMKQILFFFYKHFYFTSIFLCDCLIIILYNL